VYSVHADGNSSAAEGHGAVQVAGAHWGDLD
jgi:hypothetical protein